MKRAKEIGVIIAVLTFFVFASTLFADESVFFGGGGLKITTGADGWILRAYSVPNPTTDGNYDIILEARDTQNNLVPDTDLILQILNMASNPVIVGADATAPEVTLSMNEPKRTVFVQYTTAAGLQLSVLTNPDFDLPDLAVAHLDAVKTERSTRSGTVTVVTTRLTITNQGIEAETAPFIVDVYLSETPTLDTSAAQSIFQWKVRGPILVGQKLSNVFNVSIASTNTAGYVCVVIDPADTIKEQDSENDTNNAQCVEIATPAQ